MAEQHRQGFYDACDGNGWQRLAEGLSVEESEKRDYQSFLVESERRIPYFHVGQTIFTEEEYAALPVGATVWPSDGGAAGWYWKRVPAGYWCGEPHGVQLVYRTEEMECYSGRVIRSLPTEAA